MSEPEQPAPKVRPDDEREYLRLVDGEIKRLDRDSARQQRRHHAARTAVIAFGAGVPVLASWSAVPRPVLALFGALAAGAEAMAQLFQFQSHAVNMLHTRNALERARNRFMMGVGPYAVEPSMFTLFVEQVEDIRELADHGSLDAWQKSTTPAIGKQTPDP